MAKKCKTTEDVKAEFLRKGISVSAWARQHGASRTLVHSVLQGDRPCRFGESHRVAVLLGMKDGELSEDARRAA